MLAIVKEELLEMKKRFGDERRTEIQSVTGEVDIEDLIAEEQCVYTLTEPAISSASSRPPIRHSAAADAASPA